MTDLFGQPLSLASPSPPPDRDEASMTNGTCGLSSTTLCAPAGPDLFSASRSPLPQSLALQARLESAVRRRTDGLGSLLFNLTWKTHVTPAGRSLSLLRASAPRTTGCGSTGARGAWPTAQAHDSTGRSVGQKEKHGTKHGCACLARSADLTGWPTAKASDGSGGRTTETAGGGNAHLDREVRLAGWPTCRQTDGEKNVRSMEGSLSEIARKGSPQDLMQSAALSSWPTTTSRDWKDGEECLNVPRNALLGREVWLANWPTPMAGTAAQKGYNEAGNTDSSRKTVSLASWTTEDGPARLTVFGEMLTGSSARMASGGQLNPEHSRWLQAFPAAWENFAPTETRSALNKRKSLSKPFSKVSDLFSGWEDIL